jgi:hypothetical protein
MRAYTRHTFFAAYRDARHHGKNLISPQDAPPKIRRAICLASHKKAFAAIAPPRSFVNSLFNFFKELNFEMVSLTHTNSATAIQ